MSKEDEKARLKKLLTAAYGKENKEFIKFFNALCDMFVELCTAGGETPEVRDRIDDSVREALIALEPQKLFHHLAPARVERALTHLESIPPLMRCAKHLDGKSCRKQKFVKEILHATLTYLKTLAAEESLKSFAQKRLKPRKPEIEDGDFTSPDSS